MALTESLNRILQLKQEDDESLVEYTKRFKQAWDIMKSTIGEEILHNFVKTTKEYDDATSDDKKKQAEDNKKKATEAAQEQQEAALAQQHEKGLCYCCGKTGNYTDKCSKCDKIPRNEWADQKGIQMYLASQQADSESDSSSSDDESTTEQCSTRSG